MKIEKIDINNPPEKIIATIRNTNYRGEFKLITYDYEPLPKSDKLKSWYCITELEDIEIPEEKKEPMEGHPYIVRHPIYGVERRYYAGKKDDKYWFWYSGSTRYTTSCIETLSFPKDLSTCMECKEWEEIPGYPYPKE